jgi:hypothetical protein
MNQDNFRTEESMTVEVVNLIYDMVASSPSSFTLPVGGKLDCYRRILRSEIEDRKLLIFEDTSEMISFGYTYKKPCKVTFNLAL